MEVTRAARGMAQIASAALSDGRRASLTYLALYACGYTGRGSLARFDGLGAAQADTAFIHSLAKQVEDEVTLADWTVTGWSDDRVFLQKDDVRCFVDRQRVKQQKLVVGAPVTFSISALTPGAAPGFVFRHPATAAPSDLVSRFYLNVRPSAATWILGPLARELERRCDVAIKVLAHPRAYVRRDACVIYVRSASVGPTFHTIRRAVSGAGISLAAPVPLFTKRLCPGIGFADEPSDIAAAGLSHGQWVSELFLRAAATTREPLEIARWVTDAIVVSGRNPEYPYLRSGRSPLELEL